MKSEYRLTCEAGDVVRMPCGLVADVIRVEFPGTAMWHAKVLVLRPRTNIFRRIWLRITEESRPCEQDINRLVKLGAAA